MSEGQRNISNMNHEYYMRLAIEEAKEAGERGDRPIGAVIICYDKIISKSSSKYVTRQSDVDHAENTAVMSCAPYLREHGRQCVIYTTVEPCIMCISTIILANIRNIVFAIRDEYMKTKQIIEGIPYLRDRVFNYVPDVCREEALGIFKQFSSDLDYKIVTTGQR
jgi:tRNA(adenine34) deaminase